MTPVSRFGEVGKIEKLFVYGTLAPGKPNHSVLEDIPGSWERATLKGILLNEGWGAELGSPGIVPSAEGEDVDGYVFASSQLSEHWSMLDAFEGAAYERVPVLATLETGEMIDVFVYALKRDE